MSHTRLILKQPKGWFAAGREFAQALEILSDGAFKLYVYACLRADRYSGRMLLEVDHLSRLLGKDRATLDAQLAELQDRGVALVAADGRSWLEICDRYWPYQKPATGRDDPEPAEFIRQVRVLFLAPACVRAAFTAADEKIAASFHRRGVSLEQIRQAILLGCARKYAAALNGQTRMPITSLQYFAALVEEVAESGIPESYWEPLRRKVEQMEKHWLEVNSETK
jgi:hypothetical protein